MISIHVYSLYKQNYETYAEHLLVSFTQKRNAWQVSKKTASFFIYSRLSLNQYKITIRHYLLYLLHT